MVYAYSTAKGSYLRAKQSVFLPQVHILIHYLIHIPQLKLGRHTILVSKHSTKSYILTYYRLRKREPLIALGLPPGGEGGGGGLLSASAVPNRGDLKTAE